MTGRPSVNVNVRNGLFCALTFSIATVIAGCSHPGIEEILRSVSAAGPIRMVVGGLHLVVSPEAEIERVATALRDEWNGNSRA